MLADCHQCCRPKAASLLQLQSELHRYKNLLAISASKLSDGGNHLRKKIFEIEKSIATALLEPCPSQCHTEGNNLLSSCSAAMDISASATTSGTAAALPKLLPIDHRESHPGMTGSTAQATSTQQRKPPTHGHSTAAADDDCSLLNSMQCAHHNDEAKPNHVGDPASSQQHSSTSCAALNSDQNKRVGPIAAEALPAIASKIGQPWVINSGSHGHKSSDLKSMPADSLKEVGRGQTLMAAAQSKIGAPSNSQISAGNKHSNASHHADASRGLGLDRAGGHAASLSAALRTPFPDENVRQLLLSRFDEFPSINHACPFQTEYL